MERRRSRWMDRDLRRLGGGGARARSRRSRGFLDRSTPAVDPPRFPGSWKDPRGVLGSGEGNGYGRWIQLHHREAQGGVCRTPRDATPSIFPFPPGDPSDNPGSRRTIGTAHATWHVPDGIPPALPAGRCDTCAGDPRPSRIGRWRSSRMRPRSVRMDPRWQILGHNSSLAWDARDTCASAVQETWTAGGAG